MDAVPLTLCRWKQNLDLSSVHKAQVDPSLRLVSWIDKGKHLRYHRLGSKDVLAVGAPLLADSLLVQEYLWLPCGAQTEVLPLIILDVEQKLSLFRVAFKDGGAVEAVVVDSVSLPEVQQSAGLQGGTDAHCVSLCCSSLLQPNVVPVRSGFGDVLIFTFEEAISNLALSCVLRCDGVSPSDTASTSSKIADVVVVKELVFVLLENGSVLVSSLKSSARLGVIYCPEEMDAKADQVTCEAFRHLALLPALRHLYCCSDTGTICSVDLEDYFEMHPQSLNHQAVGKLVGSMKDERGSDLEEELEEEEKDMKILGYNPDKPLGLFDSLQHFMKVQAAKVEDRHHLRRTDHSIQYREGRRKPVTYTWHDVLKVHSAEDSLCEFRPANVGTSCRWLWDVVPAGPAKKEKKTKCFSVQKWLQPTQHGLQLSVMKAKVQGNAFVLYCGPQREGGGEGNSPCLLRKLSVLGFEGAVDEDIEPKVTKLSRLAVLAGCVSSPNFGACVIRENAILLIAFGISDRELINKVLMYDDAAAAEGVCRLNHWDKCALPLNALKMALELKQMDTIAFFLKPIKVKDHSDPHDDEEEEEWPGAAHTHLCVPLLPGQLEAALELIIHTIRKCFNEPQHVPFARQLLQLTIQFLVHVVRVEAGRQAEEKVRSQGSVEGFVESQSSSAAITKRERAVSETSEGSVQEPGSEAVSMEMLAKYMKELWSFMSEGKEETDGGSREKKSSAEKRIEDAYPVQWKGMSMRDIVKDALLTGRLPLAQTYMIRYRGGAVGLPHPAPTPTAKGRKQPSSPKWSQLTLEEAIDSPEGSVGSPLGGPSSASFESFKATGLGLAMECLESGDVRETVKIATSLGFDECECLRYICFHTVNRVLRERLLCELKEHGWLSDEEEAAVEYLHQLEQVYPMPYVEVDRGGGTERKGRRAFYQPVALPAKLKASGASPSPSSCAEAVHPESFGGDYYMTPPQSDQHPSRPTPPLYAQVPLWSVLQWDNTTKETVLLEAFLLTHDRSDSLPPSFSHHSRQAYYISHGDIGKLREETLDALPGLPEGEELPEGEGPPWPRKEVTELVEAVEAQRETYLLDAVLSDLARKGIFTDSELSDFPVLLRRLALTHRLFQQGCHPLLLSPVVDPVETADGGDGGGYLSSPIQDSAVNLFHHRFLRFCISKDFINLTYHYLDHYKLALTDDSLIALALNDPSLPAWVDVMVHCRMAAHMLNDPMAIFSASMACGRLLLGNHDKLLMQMIKHGRSLMALATLMYSDIPIKETMSPLAEDKEWSINKEVLQEVLAPHPKLRAAIFPPPPRKGTPAETQDISLYQLLQGNIPFNVSRLFGWQRTNRLCAQEGGTGDGSLELPHFSSPALVAKHSHEERLPYLFFLKQGLPSFAYANFMVSKAVTKRNFNRKVTRAVHRVYTLSLLHLQDDLVTTSCAAFLEMLGQDSTALRVDLCAARRIIDNIVEVAGGTLEVSEDPAVRREERQRSIVGTFLAVHKKESSLNATLMEGDTAEAILADLEAATVAMVKNIGVSVCSLEAEEAWELPQQFCRVHRLPLSQVYLRYCAEEGSWVSFLCHAQMHGFQRDELEGLVQTHFQPRPLAEHLLLSFTATLDDPRKALAGKSVHLRERFYHKMGVGKSQAETPRMASPLEDSSAPEEVDPLKVPADLFGIIFRCSEQEVPWKSLLAHAVAIREPLLAIVAACEKGDPITLLSCMCVWLFASMDPTTAELVTEMMGGGSVQWRGWTLVDLTLLIAAYLIHSTSPTLNLFLLFQYFDPGNPVKLMMKFLHSFVEVFDISQCSDLLRDFEKARAKSLKMCVGDQHWADKVAMMVAKHMVVSQTKAYERLHLMKLLGERKFGTSRRFKNKDVDFESLWEIVKLLDRVQIGPNQAFVTMERLNDVTGSDVCGVYHCEIKLDIELVVSQLMEKQEFEVARKCAFQYSTDKLTDVILQELTHMVKSFDALGAETGSQEERMNLWLRCNAKLEEYHIEPLTAVKFFEGQLEVLQGRVPSSEQALLYMLVLKWLRDSPVLSSEQIRRKERDIWLVHIRAMAQEEGRKTAISVTPSVLSVCSKALATLLTAVSAGEEESSQVDLSQLVLVTDMPIRSPTQSPALTIEEQDVLEAIIGKLLNLGKLQEARQLVALFDYNSRELTSVLCCILLAEGRITPSDIPHQLLRGRGKGGRRLSGTYTMGPVTPGAKAPGMEMVHWMDTLTDHSLYAKECCNRIIICYRIALTLSWPYQSVMLQKSTVDILLSLLSCSDTAKHALTQEFVILNRIPSEVMGDFLCKCITEALKGHYKIALATTESMTIYPLPTMSSDQFTSSLAQLCPEPAVLGTMLLKMATNTLETVKGSTDNSLFVVVELLVRSHDCYSMGSNTDGIAAVLREAYSCFEALSKHKKLSLMVRLLTGIGRFRDMGYIVDALITNHHFELLLQKDLENSEKLKDALLEYLRQWCPNSTEMMTLLTLRFLMEREHGQIIEEQAQRKLKEIKIKKPDANTKLKRVWEEFMNAADCYNKDDCLAHKERCLSQARLVALQLSVLSQGLQVVNLNPSELDKFLGKHASFQQALVVVNGYKYSIPVDWVDPLFKHVVVAGDFKYLSDYKRVFPLTAQLFEDLVKRSKHEQAKYPQVSQNIVSVVESEVSDTLLKRKLLASFKSEKVPPVEEGFLRDIMCL